MAASSPGPALAPAGQLKQLFLLLRDYRPGPDLFNLEPQALVENKSNLWRASEIHGRYFQRHRTAEAKILLGFSRVMMRILEFAGALHFECGRPNWNYVRYRVLDDLGALAVEFVDAPDYQDQYLLVSETIAGMLTN